MGQEFKSEYVDDNGIIQSRSQSTPLAINPSPSLERCTSSSFNASPHWPQSIGRTMEVYSRSTSRRNRSIQAESITNGLEPSLSEQFAAALDKAEKNLREPLLQDSGRFDVENAEKYQFADDSRKLETHSTKEFGLHEDDEHVQGSSFLQALFNGMNILAGVGILSTPYATANGGWLGLGFLLIFAIIMFYTGILLRYCLDSDPYINTFPDIGEASFGKWGRWIISIMLYLELYAVSIEFLILEGDNLAQLFPGVSLTIGGTYFGAQEVFAVCAALCMLPTVLLRDLRFLSYVSAGGVFASLLIVLAVGWIGVVDGVGFHHRGSLVHLDGLPVAIGLFSFCYCGHSVFPSIYSSMEDRKQFSSVLVICFVLCTFMYGGMAVMGYAMFGDELQSQITLNLPRELPASSFAIWITLISPFAKYALTLMPLAVALEEFLPPSMTHSRKGTILGGTILRIFLVMSTVIVALAVPFFGLLMAFIGSFLSVAVSIHVPCICYLRIYWERISRREVFLIVLIISIGLLAGAIGTFYSVKRILEQG
ncbi:hypothetical protein M758_1G207300 [Ceratodon purpureus]|nr:hypothetical protein M758_1G207300 [Ceratodon purpureus]